ncbi:MAG TPA: GGDEF domain-containing protein [Candidatus Elarobacter sp.]
MIARRVYGFVRAAALVTTIGLAVLYGPAAVRALDAASALFLAGACACTIALGILRAPAAHFERSARPTPESDRVGLLVPLLLAVLVTEGWLWAAALNALAFVVRPGGRRKMRWRDRLLGAPLRVPAWWAAAAIVPPLHRAVAGPAQLASAAEFVAIATVYVLAADLVWVDPLQAMRQGRSLWRFWRRHLADRGTMLTVLAESVWAYVVARAVLHDGAVEGILALTPLILIAAVLVRFARLNARLHRLALSREAVDAMLRANDPQPQMRSLLESVDPRIVREAVEVAAFGRGGADRWSRVVRFGPAVEPELERLGGRVLLELQVTGDDSASETHEQGSVNAYAARDAQGRLRGALVVFRRTGTHPLADERDMFRAAAELGPLLGEYGAIAATRTAATLDTLTGLPNRRGVSRAFEEAMVYVRDGGKYAVLLLDVDHFKSINDLLGHQTGDRALAQIGRIIAENIRGVDVAGRFGGEEFLVLLRDAARERAMQVAERLRSAIETGGLAHADGKPVTVSVGVAYARAADATTDVVERADRALYRAKNAGRNRVVESPLVAV